MHDTTLLTVEDHFLLEGRGLIVVPLLDVPSDGGFKPFSDTVLVRRPDGKVQEFTANFALEHFRMVGGGSKWNVTPMIPDGTKDTIPVGSLILVSETTQKRLNGEKPNNTVERNVG